MVKIIKTISLILILTQVIFSQPEPTVISNYSKLKLTANDTLRYLNIPDRPVNAIEGSKFADQIADLNLTDREKAVVKEILNGNVSSFSRKLRPLTVVQNINAKNYELTFYTVCDYMAIGSDQDYLYMPMTPSTAQYLADRLGCTLPTKKMVDIIYNKAEIKLKPQPIPPSDKMTTVQVFKMHTDSIKQQISQMGFDRSADNIIAGHKKDIIISNKIYSPDRSYDRVVIYGWHLSENNPIQPVYNGHIAKYADYSHGVRLISNIVLINGDSTQIDDILKDSNLSALLSDEGVISKPYYPASDIFTSIGSRLNNSRIDFKLSQNYPNPFNPTTTIKYIIGTPLNPPFAKGGNTRGVFVTLKVYDLLGREAASLVNKKQQPGNYKVEWDALSYASGIYFYTLKAGQFIQGRKMILQK